VLDVNTWWQQHISAGKVGTIQQAVAKSYDNAHAIRLQWEVGLQARWSDLLVDYTFGCSDGGCKLQCDCDDITHSTTVL